MKVAANSDSSSLDYPTVLLLYPCIRLLPQRARKIMCTSTSKISVGSGCDHKNKVQHDMEQFERRFPSEANPCAV